MRVVVRSLTFSAAFFGLAACAYAETFTIAGKTLRVDPPPGFCIPGKTAEEVAMMDEKRSSMNGSAETVLYAVPCSELQAIRINGGTVTRWVMVIVTKNGAEVRPVTVDRATWTMALSQNMAKKEINLADVERRAQEYLAKQGVSMSRPQAEGIAVTKDAFFFELRSTLSSGRDVFPVYAFAAATLVNQLPVVIYSYSTRVAKGYSAAATGQAYLKQLLTANEAR